MLEDLRTLVWLRVRHVRTTLSRMMHAAGTDPVRSEGFGDRVYQLYIVAFVLLAAALLWVALLHAVETMFVSLGDLYAVAVFQMALTLPAVFFAVMGVRALFTAPLKFSHADIAFVASSALASRAVVFDRCVAAAGKGALVALLLGYLLGIGLCCTLDSSIEPLEVAVVGSLLMVAAIGGVWIMGTFRLVGVWGRARSVVVGSLVVVAIAACCLAAVAFAQPAVLFAPSGFVVFGSVMGVFLLLEVVLLTRGALRVDWPIAIQGSVLYADLQPLSGFAAIDQNAIRDFRRRKKLAMRRPWFHLPAGTGRVALIAHAAIALVRQPESLLLLFMQGAFIIPFGTYALLSTEPFMLLSLMASLVFVPYGAREMTRTFRDDIRNRLVRDQLPFSTLELLVFDSLLPTSLGVALSLIVVVPMVFLGALSAWALPFVLLLNAALVLSCGFDAISPKGRLGAILCYEAGAAALVLGAGMVSLGFTPVATAAALVFVCGVYVGVIRSSREAM